MQDLQSVIGNLYDAVMDEDAFHPAIASCGHLIGQRHGVLLAWSGKAADMPEVVSYFTPDLELTRRYLAEYAAYYHLLDPTKARWHDAAQGDWLVDSREQAPSAWNSKAFYQDFARPMGMGGWAALKVAAADAAARSPEWALSLLRDDGSPDFSGEDLAQVSRVASHLKRALTLRQRYAALRRVAAMGMGVLDSFVLPIWVAECDGRLCHANAAAEEAMRAPVFPARQAQGRFVFCQARQQAAWDALFQSDADHALGRGLTVPALDGGQVVLQVLPLPVGLAHTGGVERPMRLIVAHLPRVGATPAWREILGSLYGYTPAEISIATELVRDRTAAEIAESRGSQADTVRFQIKSMLSKAGCRRQAELVRLLSRLGLFGAELRD